LAGLAVVVALVAGMAAIWPRLQATPTRVGAAPLQIQCRGEGATGFSPDLLSGVGNAESGTSTAANVLRQFVASPDYGQGFPAKGWYAVEQTQDRVLFLAKGQGDDPSDYLEVEVKQNDAAHAGLFATGGWSVGANGGCALRSVPPSGFDTALWSLDPAVPYAPGATELHIRVSEEGCDSGQLIPADRIYVDVQYAADQVQVTIATRRPLGAQTCPLLLGGSPYVVKLDQPIGNRDVLDGGPWPTVKEVSGGHAVVAPTPTPYPSNWHMPTDCTGDAGFFKAASMSASYDVYCAVLPSGWTMTTAGDPQLAATAPLTVEYKGPAGEAFTLEEGGYCEALNSSTMINICDRVGPENGQAIFGDRTGVLGGSNGGYYIYTPPDRGAMWTASCTGMSLDSFKTLAAALIVVAK
jgi:hypothetical protein